MVDGIVIRKQFMQTAVGFCRVDRTTIRFNGSMRFASYKVDDQLLVKWRGKEYPIPKTAQNVLVTDDGIQVDGEYLVQFQEGFPSQE